MHENLFTLLPIFFFIALFYSAAGFGGGSSYLAVLALFPLEFTTIRLLALVCNITVVSGSVYLFYKNGHLRLARIWPLVLLSIPLAYWGGSLRLGQQGFFLLLGCTLFIAALLMLFSSEHSLRKFPVYTNAIIGGGIGFLSGMVGIGGGIFLSPLLYLSRWGKAKTIAATTAIFIFVNSLAGLGGQILHNDISIAPSLLIGLMTAVFAGGQIGARLTAIRLDPPVVKKITAVLILIVAIRILVKWIAV